MNLIHYYRQQFLELITQFEQSWEEEPHYKFGFLWHSYANTSYKEMFHLTQSRQESIYLMYAIELPATYTHSNISDVIKHVASPYELSIYVFPHKLLLTSSISTDNLQQTTLGFVNQARAEIIDLVFSAITQVDYLDV
ncbi:hypothetical protein A8709_25020 [Paenibacillus pectinilyticus]|uniref:Uncharacterized protein n=1 Tax=Paenibacillus pectinilyticus TaxID=512399 RepID=A0A1C1A297_9BACL|nr:hypothetical protein [Paenibacillus pectinilyticus]OCT14647.1 hypothetical protein A8709_25020 [Paenibacillus pectinilyticus]